MGFKFGGVDVPLTPLVTRTGSLPITITGVLTELGWTNQQLFEAGIDIGGTLSPEGHGQPTGSCSFTGGRTTLHDSTELIVTNPVDVDPTAPYPGDQIDVVVSHTEGQSTITIYNETGYQIVRPAFSSVLRTQESYRLIAIPYQYTEEDTEAKRRKGYWVYCVVRVTITNLDQTLTTEFTRFTRLAFDIPLWNKERDLDMYYDENVPPEPGDDPFDPSDDDPYRPDKDDTSDEITIPTDPSIGISNAGWVHVYNPTTGGLVNFGAWLFPNPELPSSADPTEIVNYLLLLCQTLANSRLIDYILDCHIIPVSPSVSASQDIKVGGRTAVGISAPVVASDYINVSCGSLNIQEYFGGFQDFLLTISHLYLPFIGFVDVLPEYWQSGTISVDYKFNVIDGSFMAYVRSVSHRSQLNGSVIAQYSGNACMHIPITGINYSNMVSGLVGAAVAAQGAKKGASAVLGHAYSAANTMLSGGDMVQSNGYNSTAAMLGVRYPYLVIERPVPSYPSKYGHSKGFPSNIYTSLTGVSGYTIIDDIDLTGIPLMEVELNELRTLLKEGVYF